ncbi:MAG: hypothetical protein AAFW98_01905 [Pseudomonadota bacterium]
MNAYINLTVACFARACDDSAAPVDEVARVAFGNGGTAVREPATTSVTPMSRPMQGVIAHIAIGGAGEAFLRRAVDVGRTIPMSFESQHLGDRCRRPENTSDLAGRSTNPRPSTKHNTTERSAP